VGPPLEDIDRLRTRSDKMGIGALLETMIGLAFVYLLMSLLCSSLNEWIAHEFGRRGRFLRQGIVNMIPDRWTHLQVVNHPLIASLCRDSRGRTRYPSYIPSGHFAHALVDVMVAKAGQFEETFHIDTSVPPTIADIRRAACICRDHGDPTGTVLVTLLDAGTADLSEARRHIESWYDAVMDRVSGWYKQHTRWALFAVGLATSIAFNVDTIAISEYLLRADPLRQAIAQQASEFVKQRPRPTGAAPEAGAVTAGGDAVMARESAARIEALRSLEAEGLPIGFSCLAAPATSAREFPLATVFDACGRDLTSRLSTARGILAVQLLGWLITALAVGMGAPFWFDTLNKLVDVRGAGPRPVPVSSNPGASSASP
jgi:hypothetical protein